MLGINNGWYEKARGTPFGDSLGEVEGDSLGKALGGRELRDTMRNY